MSWTKHVLRSPGAFSGGVGVDLGYGGGGGYCRDGRGLSGVGGDWVMFRCHDSSPERLTFSPEHARLSW